MANWTEDQYNDFIMALEDAGFEPRPYSGRSMYGKNCAGIDCDDALDALATILHTSFDDESAVPGMAQHPKSDSIGLGQILYWPRVEWRKET